MSQSPENNQDPKHQTPNSASLSFEDDDSGAVSSAPITEGAEQTDVQSNQGFSSPDEQSSVVENNVPSFDDSIAAAMSGNMGGMSEQTDMPEVSPSAPAVSSMSSTAVESQPAPAPIQGGGDEDKKPIRIGDRLVELGIITQDQLNVALQEKRISGKMLGQVLVDLAFVSEEDISSFLAEKSGFEVFDVKSTLVEPEVLKLVPHKDAERYQILPVSISDDTAIVAMADPQDVVALDVLRRLIGRGLTINPLVANPSDLSNAIDKYYGYSSSIDTILKELDEGYDEDTIVNMNESEAYAHPIVRLVNGFLADAVKMGTSDLHFEPEENFIRLRYRIDGVLRTVQTLHKRHWSAISQRLKIMSKMNIADKLAPQDGRFAVNVGGKEVDFRVSSLPTVYGENIVLRVLDKSAGIVPMEKLGFSDYQQELIKSIQSKPEGIVIVTGPTGSGKTTTLYSMLNAINTVDVNIQTLEDPVEYALPMIRQTNVREGILEFADGIKALLRQDPDIIFVGEIRDKTTAEMALKASMTGHQVYSSLHTNDSFGALPRLWDLGLKPSMMAGAMNGVFAQRLVRTLCPACKQPKQPTEDERKLLRLSSSENHTIFHAGGCDACEGQGYRGRMAVIEILPFSEAIDTLMTEGGSIAEIKKQAIADGFRSMAEDAIDKILRGVTSIEAVTKTVDLRIR
jgi:general secretion pathway protein E/type IV pilus assembly protein PilB